MLYAIGTLARVNMITRARRDSVIRKKYLLAAWEEFVAAPGIWNGAPPKTKPWDEMQRLHACWWMHKQHYSELAAKHFLEKGDYETALIYSKKFSLFRINHKCAMGYVDDEAKSRSLLMQSYAGLGEFDLMVENSLGLVARMANSNDDLYPYEELANLYLSKIKEKYSLEERVLMLNQMGESLDIKQFKKNGTEKFYMKYFDYDIILYDSKFERNQMNKPQEEKKEYYLQKFRESYFYEKMSE